MPVTIKPISQIKVRLGIEPNGRVQKFFTQTCAIHMDKYVPFDEGTLATRVIANGQPTNNVQPSWIIYDVPYARYQYRGMREDGTHKINEANRNRTYHPLATSYWDKHMVSAEMKDVVKEVQDYVGGKRWMSIEYQS